MPDTASILSPTGAVFTPNWPLSGVNGTNVNTGYVFSVLPGEVFSNRGQGAFAVSGVSGRQGTMRVTLTTGAAGSAQAVAFIWFSPTVMLGLALDSSNRPYATLKNAFGTTVGLSAVSPIAVASGTPLDVTLAWNSQGVVFAGRQAGMLVNNTLVNWSTSPVAAWVDFPPSTILIGTSLAALGLSSFVGVIGSVQVGNQVVFAPPASAESVDNLSLSAGILGTSTVSFSASVTYAASVAAVAASSVGANANLI